MPGSLKIRDGVTKRLLREAMRGSSPTSRASASRRPGWNAPAHLWFTGPALDELRERVTSQAFRDRGIFDVREVEKLIDEHATLVERAHPVDNHMMFLWQIANVDAWLTSLEREHGTLRFR